MSFLRYREIYPEGFLPFLTAGAASAPAAHRNEFPAGYSLASCSPAELASASPTSLILQPPTSGCLSIFSKRSSCFVFLYHQRGALQLNGFVSQPPGATGSHNQHFVQQNAPPLARRCSFGKMAGRVPTLGSFRKAVRRPAKNGFVSQPRAKPGSRLAIRFAKCAVSSPVPVRSAISPVGAEVGFVPQKPLIPREWRACKCLKFVRT